MTYGDYLRLKVHIAVLKEITMDYRGKTTVREFVELTKNAYGGDIIKKLPQAYGITD